MPTTIVDELKTVVSADTDKFVQNMRKAGGAISSFSKKEQEAQKSLAFRTSAVRGSILDPGGAAKAGLDKLVGSMKFSAVTAGVLGAGLDLAAGKLSELRATALEARKATEELNESFRQLSQANKTFSKASDTGSLSTQLEALRAQEKVLEQRDFELNPRHGSAAAGMLKGRYFAEDPLHGNENLKRDRNNTKMQLDDNGKDQAVIMKDISESYRIQNDLVKEQLSGSGELLRIKELNLAREREIKAIQGTTANNPKNLAAISGRYDDQVAAEQEQYDARQRQAQVAALNQGTSASALSDEAKKAKINQSSLALVKEELRNRRFLTDEARRTLELQRNGLEIEGRQQREAMLMGKTPAQVNAFMLDQRNRSAEISKFRQKDAKVDGLVRPEKDMNGNVTGGLDPITGEHRNVTPGMGKSEQGLTTGGLGGAYAAPGSVRRTIDADDGGGLHSGSGGSQFTGSSAERYLNNRPTVEGLLGASKGDPGHDPMARLGAAPTLPDLKKTMGKEFSGTYRIPIRNASLMDVRAQNLANGAKPAQELEKKAASSRNLTVKLLGEILKTNQDFVSACTLST